MQSSYATTRSRLQLRKCARARAANFSNGQACRSDTPTSLGVVPNAVCPTRREQDGSVVLAEHPRLESAITPRLNATPSVSRNVQAHASTVVVNVPTVGRDQHAVVEASSGIVLVDDALQPASSLHRNSLPG